MCSPVERQLPHLSSHDLLSGAELTGGLTVEQAHPPIEARCGAAHRWPLATGTAPAPFGAGNIELTAIESSSGRSVYVGTGAGAACKAPRLTRLQNLEAG